MIIDLLESQADGLIPPLYRYLFHAMDNVLKDDAKGTLHSLANLLRIKNLFVLEMIIAVLRKDTDFVRYSTNNFFYLNSKRSK